MTADRHRPHALAPAPNTARVALVYKNFGAVKGLSHIGLGVAALNTMRTLRTLGYDVQVWPASTVKDVEARLALEQEDAHRQGRHPISHVVIAAPWIQTLALQALLGNHPDVQFAVVSHSNVGFLQADPDGIRLLREGMDLSLGTHNFIVAGNCNKFVRAWTTMYGRGMQHLPNLYDCSTIKPVGLRPPWHPGGTLRLGVFGAVRPLKNMVTAAAACIELAASMRADVEIWVSSGRNEGGAVVPRAIEQLTARVPGVTLREAGWRSWPEFRTLVARMHALVNVSYTESFCMVAADGIAEGVASSVSGALDWCPSSWYANNDDATEVAAVTRRLLGDPRAVDEGQAALRAYVAAGAREWCAYLGGER